MFCLHSHCYWVKWWILQTLYSCLLVFKCCRHIIYLESPSKSISAYLADLYQKIFFCSFISSEQQSNESTESTMTVETQQNHDRLLGKNGVSNNVVPASNSNGVKKSTTGQQQKDDQFKQRFTENTMQVCNVNLMENTLASR